MARRRGPTLVVGVAIVVVGLAAARVHGETVDATATTLLSGRADVRDGHTYTVVPAYEQLSVLASDLKVPYLDDVAGGDARLGRGDPHRRGPSPSTAISTPPTSRASSISGTSSSASAASS